MQNEKPAIQPTVPSAEPVAYSSTILPTPSKDLLLDWALRLGLAFVFIINSLTALIQPESFLKLLQHNFASRAVGHYSDLTHLIFINDMIIGLLIVSGWKKKYVLAWAGVWLALVTFFKATALI